MCRTSTRGNVRLLACGTIPAIFSHSRSESDTLWRAISAAGEMAEWPNGAGLLSRCTRKRTEGSKSLSLRCLFFRASDLPLRESQHSERICGTELGITDAGTSFTNC